jgi:ABC-2 type transport system permease protein
MSAPEIRVPRAPGKTTIVRPRMTAIERLKRIIERRELLVGMVRNELKIKYKNSVLGFAWSLLNPFTIIRGSGIPAFPIWLLSGLLVWNLFSTGLGAATGSVVANSGLVKKVSFPREILPLAAVGSMLVHFFLQSMVLFVVLAIVRWDLAWAYVPLIPLALMVLLLLTSALGILLSAINVYLRDTTHFLELALLAWFWVTPIVYQYQIVAQKPGWSKWPWFANPVTPIVLIFQRSIYARLDNVHFVNHVRTVTPLLPHWPYWAFVAYLGYSLAFAVVTLAVAVRVFGRSEANFAEEL